MKKNNPRAGGVLALFSCRDPTPLRLMAIQPVQASTAGVAVERTRQDERSAPVKFLSRALSKATSVLACHDAIRRTQVPSAPWSFFIATKARLYPDTSIRPIRPYPQ